MKFSQLPLKAKYESDEDDILNSFYIPMLANATHYDRAVGYFSADVLVSAATGLEKFILNNGKMRLIIGDPLSDMEYEAVMNGISNPLIARSTELSELLLQSEHTKLRVLSYLIANQQLEIKFAFTHKGMFHKKVGIFQQPNETVVFSGSANETLAGLSKYNTEEISVFFSWKPAFEDYGRIEVHNFEALWENKRSRAKVIALDSDAYKKIQDGVDLEKIKNEIINNHKSKRKPNVSNKIKPFFQYSFPKSDLEIEEPTLDARVPRKPLVIGENPFELFEHQVKAIASWEEANHNGILKLATGSGKTFTSITALVELYEKRRKTNRSTFSVVAVPYVELANQWVRELALFNITPVQCYDSEKKWTESLSNKILRFLNDTLNFVCIVVVNKTLSSDTFQTMLKKVPNETMLFIGDECHRLGSDVNFKALPTAKYRLGLSATPFRSEDEELEDSPFDDRAKENLLSYFNGVVSEYSLLDAIHDEILAPYTYDLVAVHLTDEEQGLYDELSLKIAKLIHQSKNANSNEKRGEALNSLCGQRSRLLATCEGKLPALIRYLKLNNNRSLAHSLIYVGEGTGLDDEQNYILRVTNTLFENGYSVAKFTSLESPSERAKIMDDFKNNHIDSLVAMKVLDEGIDVPVCKSAFILASTRNPRQYIQRRGRVLRKSEGKDEALIVDFVVLPTISHSDAISDSLRRAEYERIEDFKRTCKNPHEVEQRLRQLGINYGTK